MIPSSFYCKSMRFIVALFQHPPKIQSNAAQTQDRHRKKTDELKKPNRHFILSQLDAESGQIYVKY